MRCRPCIVCLAVATVLAASALLGIRWNVSPSVAPGLYLARQRAVIRGDLALVCLPEVMGRWARLRGYLRPGRCPSGSQPLGKWIAGVPGDRVEIFSETVAINGLTLEGSSRERTDAHDRPVPMVAEGVLVLGRGEFWLHSGRHRRSLDSRVYGPLDRSSIQAVLEPLWTFPGN